MTLGQLFGANFEADSKMAFLGDFLKMAKITIFGGLDLGPGKEFRAQTRGFRYLWAINYSAQFRASDPFPGLRYGPPKIVIFVVSSRSP